MWKSRESVGRALTGIPEQTVGNMFLQLSVSAFSPFLPSSQRSLFRNLDVPKEQQQGPPAAANAAEQTFTHPSYFFPPL